MKRIVLAYDGSPPAQHAARRAAEVARLYEASVLVLVVGELIESGYGTQVPVMAREEYDKLAAQGVEEVAAAGVEAASRVIWGAPAAKIVEEAKSEGADLVVMGHRGGGLKSFLLGSVARHVIDHAECSVLVVR